VPTSQPSLGRKGSEQGRASASLLLEGFLVAAAGLVLALAANWLSPRGLALSRDYLHIHSSVSAGIPGATTAATLTAWGTNVASTWELLAAQLQQEGLGLADSNQVAKAFRDPRFERDLVVFIDARDDDRYQHGHIPGAYQLDYYHPGPYLATVLAVCQIAQEIVVYCNGGDCEDSRHTAMFLRDAGIPAKKLFVYAGGISEWTTNGLPLETGQRKSGSLLDTNRSGR